MKKCRRCGKTLADNAKVCSRCGLKFTHSTTKPSSSESYDRYRKKKMQKERMRKRSKRRARLLVFWAFLLAIIVGVAAGVYVNDSYKPITEQSTETNTENPTQAPEGTPAATETAKPEETEAPKKTEEPLTAKNIESKAEQYGCSVYEDASYEFKCAYPSEFVEGSLKNNNTRLSLKDESGGGEMLIGYEKVGKNKTASELMDEYIQQSGVDPEFDNVKNNFYSVTFTRAGRNYHRKAVVFDEKYIYYDFIYDQGSDSGTKYEEYIDFIDTFFEYMNKPV